MSTLKLALGIWLMPLPISLIVVCTGLLLKLTGRRRIARALIGGGVIFALAATLGPTANGLLRPLETRYPAILDASILSSAPRYVAVLGSGYYPRDALPVTAALDGVGVVRLAEGIRLFRQLPSARLILSGGPVRDEPPIARGYALAAVALGVSPASLILIDTPLDTDAEIHAIHALVGEAAVLLVTSAVHTPRAIALARREGLHAIAAPTGNLMIASGRGYSWLPLPSGRSLFKSETAFHEYLGLLALSLGIS
jgi:uncharacterized SAM-binding protein YcdF (DUF218 family)